MPGEGSDPTLRHGQRPGRGHSTAHEQRPVVARPPSAAYKLQKAWQRNKLVFTAGAAVFLALAAGLTLAALGWTQTLAQRNAAQASEERAIQEGQRVVLLKEE